MLETRERRSIVRPNSAFVDQLRALETRLGIPPSSDLVYSQAKVLTRFEKLEMQERELDVIQSAGEPYDKRKLYNAEAELDKVDVVQGDALHLKRKALGNRCRQMLGEED